MEYIPLNVCSTYIPLDECNGRTTNCYEYVLGSGNHERLANWKESAHNWAELIVHSAGPCYEILNASLAKGEIDFQ
jgi:hypothetical protein